MLRCPGCDQNHYSPVSASQSGGSIGRHHNEFCVKYNSMQTFPLHTVAVFKNPNLNEVLGLFVIFVCDFLSCYMFVVFYI